MIFLKSFITKVLNKIYLLTLAKPRIRDAYNDFLFFFLWKTVFALSSIFKTNSKLVLFVADFHNQLPDEYKSLYQMAKEKGYKCVCIYKFKSNSRIAFANEFSKFKNDLKFQRLYARAKVTFLYDYYLPAYANKPRKNSRLVQLWHGCGAFKKFGYSTKDCDWGMNEEKLRRYNVHKTYTDVLVSSEFIKDKYAQAFDLSEEKIEALGVARTDVYFDSNFVQSQKEVLTEKYPFLKDKKLILYAPTFRGNSLNSSKSENAIDLVKLCKNLQRDCVFLIKLHPLVRQKPNYSKEEADLIKDKVLDISDTVSIQTALCCADLVITDYSSLIFEYAILKRPMIFYAYDLEEYDSGRSFYYDYSSFVPGEIAKSTDELITLLKKSDEAFDKEKIEMFREKFMSSCDGHSTKRIFEKFIEN